MAKFDVTIERMAWTMLTYRVEADTEEDADAHVQRQIDANNISDLGVPCKEDTVDDGDSQWEIVATEQCA